MKILQLNLLLFFLLSLSLVGCDIQSQVKDKGAAEEVSALATLKKIQTAQMRYKTNPSHKGYASSLKELARKNFLSKRWLKSNTKAGYRFSVKGGGNSYEVLAVPKNKALETSSFLLVESGTIHYATGGNKPTRQSPTR